MIFVYRMEKAVILVVYSGPVCICEGVRQVEGKLPGNIAERSPQGRFSISGRVREGNISRQDQMRGEREERRIPRELGSLRNTTLHVDITQGSYVLMKCLSTMFTLNNTTSITNSKTTSTVLLKV